MSFWKTIMKKNPAFGLSVLGALAVWLALYFAVIHPGVLTWGATPEENARVLAGERPGGPVPPAPAVHTRAIAIEAPPEAVWPWLANIGIGRGGFYSYDWLENLFLAGIHNGAAPGPAAATRPDGDFVRSFQFWPDAPGRNGWRFVVLEAGRSFFLDPLWGPFVLEPAGPAATRLLVRSRATERGPVGRALMGLFFDPIHFTMEKRMMVEVKRLAEGRPDAARPLRALAGLGYGLAAIFAAAVIVTRPRKKLWILLPLAYGLAVAVLAKDLISALVGFTALAIIVAGFRALGRRGWALVAGFWIYVDLVLIYARDAFPVFGAVFLAAALILAGRGAARSWRRTRPSAAADRG